MKQKHTSAMSMKQFLSTTKYLEIPRKPQLSDFYHPSEGQKNGELLFVICGGLATYALYEYLK